MTGDGQFDESENAWLNRQASFYCRKAPPGFEPGMWICNPSSDSRNTNPGSDLQNNESTAYRAAYRADLVEDVVIDRRLAFDARLRRIVEAWPILNCESQRIVLELVDRLS